MLNRAKGLWSTLSPVNQLVIIGSVVVVIALLMTLSGGIVHLVESKHRANLQERNVQLQADYNKLLGEARAHELAVAELKLKDAAKAQAIEQGNKNVQALDDKIEKAVEKYENDKKNLGDCLDAADCAKRLCLELRAAGFAVNCAE